MNNNFKKFIHTSKNIKLSEKRKDLVRGKVVEFVEMNPIRTRNPQPLQSPFYLSKFSVLNFSKAVSFALIVLIAGGSTMSYASEDTLPGDLFYTVKVNFTEPIQTSLALSPQAKLEVKTKHVEKRLTEAQILLKNNDTTPQKHAEVEARVERKVSEISKTITKLQEKGDVETILKTTSQLEPVLQAHRQALQDIIQQETQTNAELFSNTSDEETLFTITPLSEISDFPAEEIITDIASDVSKTNLPAEKSKTEIADTLLRQVEASLVKVEKQEVETLVRIEEFTQNGSDKASQVATSKVLELSKEIASIKQANQKALDIQSQNSASENTNNDIEMFLDTSISEMNETFKQDIQEIMLIEAEILLEESRQLFEQGLHKEALLKAQEALKLTGGFEISQRLTILKESVTTGQTNQINTVVQPPVDISETEKEIIHIESQAIQVIQSLEKQLNIQ